MQLECPILLFFLSEGLRDLNAIYEGRVPTRISRRQEDCGGKERKGVRTVESEAREPVCSQENEGEGRAVVWCYMSSTNEVAVFTFIFLLL